MFGKSIYKNWGEKVNSMTNIEIKEFKECVKDALIRCYNMSEVEAYCAVRDSYLSVALQRDKDYVVHDTVEEWADFIFKEVNDGTLQMM